MDEIYSDGLRLDAFFSRPPGSGRVPAVLLVPGFPRGTGGAALAGNTYPPLAERIARDAGWAACTFHFRGTGASEGDFTISGWQRDLAAAITALRNRDDVAGVWLAGFRLGGSLAIVSAADDPEVRGLATFAAPVSLQSWVPDAARFADYCRRVGVVHTDGFPADVDAWGAAIAGLDIEGAAARIAPRPWMLAHGSDDDVVPMEHARRLEAASGHRVQFRVVEHGAHRLRHDPRAIAMLLGWLDRQRV